MLSKGCCFPGPPLPWLPDHNQAIALWQRNPYPRGGGWVTGLVHLKSVSNVGPL